ncbi:unnamed protein product [Urochloa humidicola]
MCPASHQSFVPRSVARRSTPEKEKKPRQGVLDPESSRPATASPSDSSCSAAGREKHPLARSPDPLPLLGARSRLRAGPPPLHPPHVGCRSLQPSSRSSASRPPPAGIPHVSWRRELAAGGGWQGLRAQGPQHTTSSRRW